MTSTITDSYDYDVFISSSADDRAWVRETLVLRLEAVGLKVYYRPRDALAGTRIGPNIEAIIERSRHILAVLTPAWLNSEWDAFTNYLVVTKDPAGRGRSLIPVLLKPCALPLHLEGLERIDLTDEQSYDEQFERLIRSLGSPMLPPAIPTRWQDRIIAKLRRLMRQRRIVRRAVVVLITLGLTIVLAVPLPPFRNWDGWQALGPSAPVPGALTLWQSAGVLLIGTGTPSPQCGKDPGIWRSVDAGQEWQPVTAPLAINAVSGQCPLAAVNAFANSPADPTRVYAATSHVGLLRSDDSGETETWSQPWEDRDECQPTQADNQLCQLRAVAVAPDDPERVFVVTGRGNLFRSDNGGTTWMQLSGGQGHCVNAAPLAADLEIETVLTVGHSIYIGTGGSQTATSAHAGLYHSTDGGDCWKIRHDGNKRYSYRGLAALPGHEDEVLVLVRDYQRADGAQFLLWRIGDVQKQPLELWRTSGRAARVFVDDRAPLTWYLTDDRGALFSGNVDGTVGEVDHVTRAITRLLRCMFSCNVALAADPQGTTPLLLAEDRVYRLGKVPWYRYFWP